MTHYGTKNTSPVSVFQYAQSAGYVIEVYRDRKDVDHVAKLVSNDELKDAKYRMSVSAWVEPEDTREKVDIKALNAEIAEIVRILDSFQELDDALTAEIKARETQLDYMRTNVCADRTHPLVPHGYVRVQAQVEALNLINQ